MGKPFLIYITISFALKLVICKPPRVTLRDGSPVVGREAYGANDKLVTEFLGIPFAEPPVGNLRFRKPVPKKPWRTEWDATKLPSSCIQTLDYYFGNFSGATMWNANVPMSEDCLYLNVVIPGAFNSTTSTQKLPVLFWVYGGGFWSGCSTLAIYDAKILASEENVIFVSMNYRVSVFGFLYLGRKEAPGNMGLWDQLEALKWVHKNIDLFGGDPEMVTLWGESAGAASVSMHLLSPHSSPFFKRAIAQSGSATARWAMQSRQVALARSVSLYEKLGCGNMSVRDPRQWNFDKVLNCLMNSSAEMIQENEWVPTILEFVEFPWVPIVDGDFLIEQPSVSLKYGHFKRGELLVGSNLDEAIYFIVYTLSDVFPQRGFFNKTEFIKARDVWKKSAKGLLPHQMIDSSLVFASIIHEYEPSHVPVLPQDWLNALDKMLGDLHFTCNVNELALANSNYGGQTYYYYFTHRATQQTWPLWMGVVHGYEINFIFGEPLNTKEYSYTAEEQELSRRFMRYWANFARTGNPSRNSDGTYTPDNWPQYDERTMEYINLTVESDYNSGASRRGNGPRKKHCDFWKKYLPELLAATENIGENLIKWRQEMNRWQNEYMVDWLLHFEQYKKYQAYRYADAIGAQQCLGSECKEDGWQITREHMWSGGA